MLDVVAVSSPSPIAGSSFADDARAGLMANGQKSLLPKYLYDALGSALFEAITQLPEYGLWRAEKRLLTQHAEELAKLTNATNVIELGSGSATKTLPLLAALLRRRRLSYCSVDVSPTALEMTRRELGSLQGLTVRGIDDEYLPGLESAMGSRAAGTRTLVMFLGSSLGNLDAFASRQFLKHIRRVLLPGDNLLLGADLDKSGEQLLKAYDDALGVTAAFNLNLLVRMNRELDADFVLPQFRHRAQFNAELCNVEMHLESLCDQTVQFSRAGFSMLLRAGETIHTESSHKYSLQELDRLISDCGFCRLARWVDQQWGFVSGLFVAV